ncbi:MAG: hypothetical protein ABJZ55_20610 [Fuerstiella sp.]
MKRCLTSIQRPAGIQTHKPTRKGSFVIEVIVASVLMASLAAIFLPGIASINQQRLAIRDDALVLIELNNLAEKATSNPSASLTLSDWFTDRYPTAKLDIQPVPESVSFQPIEAGKNDPTLDFSYGQKIQITTPSQAASVPITRSVVVWPATPSAEGVSQ